jgi:branched-chain amino acid transport system permease protein
MNAWQRRVGATLLLGLACIVLELTFHHIVPDTAYRNMLQLAMVNVIIALSLNVINGMAGQFSIGHAGFVGVGAYTAAIVASNIHKSLGERTETFRELVLVMPPAILAAGARRRAVRVRRGPAEPAPQGRLPGDRHARLRRDLSPRDRDLAPGGQKEGIRATIAELGGQKGYAGPTLRRRAVRRSVLALRRCHRACDHHRLAAEVLGWGRALRALREDEIAAARSGVDPTRYKVTSFVIAATGAGARAPLLARCATATPRCSPISSPSPYRSTPSRW